ncbi:MAG: cation transporter [Candidatus Altiarchaeota archaeon]|nr:cation transporter [Candidatus Altiarchaeota archaeon]
MVKCKNCGTNVGEGFKFCEECGELMTKGKAKVSTPASKPLGAHGRHVMVGLVVVLAVVAVSFLLNQGGTSTAALASTDGQTTTLSTLDNDPTPQAAGSGELKKLTASIQGMTCGGCVAGIERKVSALSGVKSVAVSLASRSGEFVYDPQVVDKKTILDTITDYGYPASEVSDAPSSGSAAVETSTVSSGATCGVGGGGCGG